MSKEETQESQVQQDTFQTKFTTPNHSREGEFEKLFEDALPKKNSYIPGTIMDGTAVAKAWSEKYRDQIKGRTLAILQIGNNLASTKYIQMKQRKADELGVNLQHIQIAETEDIKTILKNLETLNKDTSIDAILVQLPIEGPLAKHHIQILEAITPAKDIDFLTSARLGMSLVHKVGLPATASGIVHLLEYYQVPIVSSHIVFVGASLLCNKPLAMYYESQGATVTICNEYTKDLASITRTADILITTVGVKNLITAEHVKKGVIVVDAGFGIDKLTGKVYGDVDFEAVRLLANLITPVPGGVGPMTIAALFAGI